MGPKFHFQSTLPFLDEEGSIWPYPEVILNARVQQRHQHTMKEVLLQWKDTPPEDATWEPTSILQRFPHLPP